MCLCTVTVYMYGYIESAQNVYISFDTLGFDIRQWSRWDVKSREPKNTRLAPPAENELQAATALELAAEIEIKAEAAEEEAAWVAIRKQRSLLALDKVPSMAEFLHQHTVLRQYFNLLHVVSSKLVCNNNKESSLVAIEIKNQFQ